ncbi:MAG TPA: hypothetical protein VGN63_23360 [Flavisolibacter sp.]|jgi:hypothetical protein|nr:hypothetical protein [Flavisolibacter sp.]
MNAKLFTIPGSLLLVVTLFFASCTKEGPAGPAGPAGPQGAAGPQGSTGPAGSPGTANVYYSSWLDVPFTPNTDSSAWTGLITATRLVDSIIQRGDVKVYLNVNTAASPTIVPLPLDALAFGMIVTPLYQVGRITLVASDDAGTFTDTNNQKAWQYRYILIPGGTSTGRIASIDWNNYKEVKSYLGLKD